MFLSNIKFNWLTNNYSAKSRYTNPYGILSKAVIKQKKKKKSLKYIFRDFYCSKIELYLNNQFTG